MIQYPPMVVTGIVRVVAAGIFPATVEVKLPDEPTQETLLLEVLKQ